MAGGADSAYARRITADTPMEITGPAAGHDRMKTCRRSDRDAVLGMLNNCAGGVTPWGTWLTCEENFNGYFWGKLADDHPEAAQLQALRRARQALRLGQVARPLRHRPRSRTSRTASAGSSRSIRSIPLRRRRSAPRSAASSTRAPPASSTRTAATSSIRATTSASTTSTSSSPRGTVDPNDRAANMDLLDEGTLYVARYDADGTRRVAAARAWQGR